MSLSDEIKAALEADSDLMDYLTGGIYNDVEEINRQNTPEAFDANGELEPCALIKLGTESKLRSGILNSVNTPITIYFYQRAGYNIIEPAMDLAYVDLNDKKIGSHVWNIEYDIAVHQQRDTALDCALGSLRFVAKRMREIEVAGS
ncbi:MAG: hypothetical protein EHM40_11580 [Chloroflexi bacterium]|nr:MAG: hypothetical protein EHM40_11580 [Chloroflexota bacterium]